MLVSTGGKVVEKNPLIGLPPEEVPLKEAPLVLVIAQVRFSPILSIEKKSFISSFQEAIRDKYPLLRSEQTRTVYLNDQGLASTESQVTWRFIDAEGNWRVSLSPEFIALETTAYSSRRDFLERLKTVLIALESQIKPSIVERFGMRYVDRLVGAAVKDVPKFFRPELTAIVSGELGKYVNQCLNQYLIELPDSDEQILARWGLIPPDATTYREVLEPIADPSWTLDLDISISTHRDFDVELLMEQAQRFAERLYALFRWAVTDEFLRYFGGEV